MNLLLTCAGRRVFYVNEFKKALGARGRVFACDSSADAPALRHANRAFVVPDVVAEGYVDSLLELCRAHHVGLLIPILEPELPLLAENRQRFAAIGTRVVVSTPEVIATCYDKLQTARFLAECGLAVPRTFCSVGEARAALARGEVRYPLVVKPRWGVGSIGLAFPETDEELAAYHGLARRQIAGSFLAGVSATAPEESVLIQEMLGGVEYGIDVINDLTGRYVSTFARRKLRMRSGQTDRAVTARDDQLQSLGRLLSERLGHVGPLDCDVFVDGSGTCTPIDLNPRIGGGYAFCHLAGANLPAALIAWALGEAPNAAWFEYQADMTVSRFDAYVVSQSASAKRSRQEWVPNASAVIPSAPEEKRSA